MKEKIMLGSAPPLEDCAQVGSYKYEVLAHKECHAYKQQLRRTAEAWMRLHHQSQELPKDFSFIVLTQAHDFGYYFEVACKFDSEDEISWDLALYLEGEGPTHWDAEAKAELNQ